MENVCEQESLLEGDYAYGYAYAHPCWYSCCGVFILATMLGATVAVNLPRKRAFMWNAPDV
jgi:hypothetical protein